jgi:hypothetical protein
MNREEVIEVKIEAVSKMKHEAQLMRLPNVTVVAIGEKRGKEVIKIF